MKRLIIFLAIVWALVPIPFPTQGGAYNTLTGNFVCKTELDCYHEIGHKLDQKSDWISQSKSFYEAQYIFMSVEFSLEKPHPLAERLLKQTIAPKPWYERFVSDSQEAYAIIFAYSKGDKDRIPPIFHDFYDWELAEELIVRYVN